MPKKDILLQVGQKDSNKEKIAVRAAGDPAVLKKIFDGVKSEKARVKYGCEKVLRLISETKPEVLYPHIGFFIDLLDSEETILKWGAIATIGNLAKVDVEKTVDKVLDRYLKPIEGPVMITAGNTLAGAAKIARAKPELTVTITRACLRVEHAEYKTPECRNIAIGHALKAFEEFYDVIPDPQPVIEFARRQLENTRNATKKKAETFLKKHQKK